jgi:hypothetical protein
MVTLCLRISSHQGVARKTVLELQLYVLESF